MDHRSYSQRLRRRVVEDVRVELEKNVSGCAQAFLRRLERNTRFHHRCRFPVPETVERGSVPEAAAQFGLSGQALAVEAGTILSLYIQLSRRCEDIRAEVEGLIRVR